MGDRCPLRLADRLVDDHSCQKTVTTLKAEATTMVMCGAPCWPREEGEITHRVEQTLHTDKGQPVEGIRTPVAAKPG